MATGASTADCAVILVDARKGLLTQTRRHSYIVALLGIKDVVLAVNKMDLVGYSEDRFREIEDEYGAFAARDRSRAGHLHSRLGPHRRERLHPEQGARVVRRPDADGISRDRRGRQARSRALPFRMPVQWVNRPTPTFGARRDRSSAAASAPASRSRRAFGRDEPGGADRHRDGDLEQAVGGPVSHGDAGGRAGRQPRRRDRRRRCAARESQTSSRPRSSGCTRSRCCAGAAT